MNLPRLPRSREAKVVARGLIVLTVIACCGGLLSAAAVVQQPQSAGAQGEFVPVKELPQQEHLAAAPLVITAYIVVWLALLVYLWTIWRRLGQVDHDLRSLSRRLEEKGAAKR